MNGRNMKRGRQIIILCEGETEKIAVRYFIAKQWRNDGLGNIGLRPIDLRAKLEDVFEFTPRYNKDNRVLAVFTLIDLQGMTRVKHPPFDSLKSKVDRVKAWLRDGIEDSLQDFFHPHVAVHETEAWLLADGNALARRLKDRSLKPDSAAEEKDFQNPPSKRLNTLFRRLRGGDGYHKIKDGRPLFEAAEFRPIYDTCSYFREFYDDLKSVGANAS